VIKTVFVVFGCTLSHSTPASIYHYYYLTLASFDFDCCVCL